MIEGSKCAAREWQRAGRAGGLPLEHLGAHLFLLCLTQARTQLCLKQRSGGKTKPSWGRSNFPQREAFTKTTTAGSSGSRYSGHTLVEKDHRGNKVPIHNSRVLSTRSQKQRRHRTSRLLRWAQPLGARRHLLLLDAKFHIVTHAAAAITRCTPQRVFCLC